MSNTYGICYHERVNNYWFREIEAETLEIAQDLFLQEIQGTEPEEVLVSSWFEEN